MLPIWVISLERSTERRTVMHTQLKALGLSHEFVPAVDGRRLEPPYRERLTAAARGQGHYELTPGELGCYLSHLNLWQRMCAEGFDAVVIMEDDVRLADDLPEVLARIEALDRPWDLIRLAGLRLRASLPLRRLNTGRKLAFLLNTACGTQCYCLSRTDADKLLATALPVRRPVDIQIDRFWDNGLAILAVQPYPVSERQEMRSEIQQERGSLSRLHQLNTPIGRRIVQRGRKALASWTKRGAVLRLAVQQLALWRWG